MDAICNTPIREHGDEDALKWRFESKGCFSVKSAYLLETGYYDGDPNTSGRDRKKWSRMVWSLSIPPKVRVFAWRALSNIIPTTTNLRNQHVPTDGICRLCDDRWSSTEHSLLFCPRVRRIWKSSRFWSVLQKASSLELADIADGVMAEYGEEDYELWVLMLWKVWNCICKVTHDEKEDFPADLESECMALWEAYQAAKPICSGVSQLGVVLGERVWCRPRRDRYRVDVDVTFRPEMSLFGVGIIVRNHGGEIMLAAAKRTAPYSNVMIAEMMAVVHGIMVCMEYHLEPIEIYTDSILVARIMANREEEGELMPDDIHDIVEVARQHMLVGVFHMYRSANRAAHCLAQYVRHCSRPSYWTADFPSWLREIVSDDVS